jgi:hypothetical protein
VTRIAVTSAVRHAGQAQFSGYLRVVDVESGQALLAEPVPESPWRSVDPNPRGGTRGARGVSAQGDRLAVANGDTVFVFDPAWRRIAALTHPFAGAVHDVLAEADGLWLTCANADLLLRLGWAGAVMDRWCWREDPALVEALGFRSLPSFDAALDYRDPRVLQGGVHNIGHLNAVARSTDGLLLSFGRVLAPREVGRRALKARVGRFAARLGLTRPYPTRPSAVPASTIPNSSYAVVLLRPDRSAELLLHVAGVPVPNHNLHPDGELLVYGDSNGGRLVAWDTRTRSERSAAGIPGDPSFVRGLARLDDGTYLVGSQNPLAVHLVDLTRGRLTGSLALGGEPNESVYGICVVPEHFAEVPGTVFGAAPAAAAARGAA